MKTLPRLRWLAPYLMALPLRLHESWLAAALFIGIVSALKFPLAAYCGRRLLDRDFGVLWAVAMFVPGWSTFEQLLFMNTNAAPAAMLGVLALCLRMGGTAEDSSRQGYCDRCNAEAVKRALRGNRTCFNKGEKAI